MDKNMSLFNIPFQSDELQNENELQINSELYSNQFDFLQWPIFPIDDKIKIKLPSLLDDKHLNIPDIKSVDFSNMKTKQTTFTVMIKNYNKGRRRISNNEVYYGSSHNKYSSDNVIRKLQIHYISFIISLVNIFLKELHYHEKFYKIDYSYKKNVSKKHIDKLKMLTIGELLCKKISPKYLREKANNNIKLYHYVKDDPIICDLLSCKYLDLFHFYMKKDNLISIGNIVINLNNYNIKLYKELVNENINDPILLKRLEEYKKKYFQDEKHFEHICTEEKKFNQAQ